MRRALSAIFGSLIIIAVIAGLGYFIFMSLSNQPAQIKFVSNGGTAVEMIQVEPGNDISAPPTPEREGYTFTGWYIDRGLTSKYNFSKMPEKSLILYAGWEEKILTVSFYLPMYEGGAFVYDGDELVLNSKAYTQKSVGYGKELTQNNIPASLLNNYEGFTGVWKFYNAETGEEVTSLTDIKVNIVAKPVFSVKQYNLYFYIGSPVDGELYKTITVDYDSALVLPDENPNKKGHTFNYWTYINDAQEEVELDEIKQASLFVRNDLHFGSDYTINTYLVYFYSNEGTLLDTQRITYGEFAQDQIDKTREDMQRIGYTFSGWKIASGQRVDLSNYIIEDNIDLYPDFDRAYYKVAFFYNDPNTGDKMIWNTSTSSYEPESDTFTYTAEYEYESSAMFPALPTLINFRGVDWVGYTGSQGFSVTANTDVEVQFERIAYIIKFSGNQHTTFRDDGKEVVVTVDESLSEVWGTRIKNGISNPQKTGFEFFGWNTNVDGTGSTFNKDFVLQDDLTVYADWYAHNASHWGFDEKRITVGDEEKTVAVIKSYSGSERKVKIPEQLYSELHGMIDVYQLGAGATYIQNIDRIDYLVVPTNVEIIASNAFFNRNIITIKFSEGSRLKTIGDMAFSSNSSTRFDNQASVLRIELPASVSDISETAFRNAVRLVSINVDSDNQSYSSIDGVLYNKAQTILYAIPNRIAVKNITVPTTVKTIKAYASSFESSAILSTDNAPYLERLMFADGSQLETIEEGAFLNNMNLRYFAEKVIDGTIYYTNLPNLKTVGISAFKNTYLATFNLQTSKLETIGKEAFYNCVWLKNFSLPSTVTSIGDSAFEKCQRITEVVYPANVSHIAKSVFSGCTNLTTFSFTTSSSIAYIDEAAFNNTAITSANFNVLRYLGEIKANAFNGTAITAVDLVGLPVTTIGSQAFANCASLTTFKINSSLATLATDALSITPKLSIVTVEAGNTSFAAQDNVLYNSSVTTLIIYPSGIEAGNFNVPNTVTGINKFAFTLNSSLTTINLSNSVEVIGESAFQECSALTTVTGFSNVTTIGPAAFKSCAYLRTIGATPDIVNLGANVVTISKEAFSRCSSIVRVDGLNSCETIGQHAFSYCENLQGFGGSSMEIVIPSSVTSISDFAFAYSTAIQIVVIPASVVSIGQGVFCGITNLSTVQIASDSNLLSIGDSAFSACTGLTTFLFLGPCAIQTIGNGSAGGVFQGCTSLTSIDFTNCTQLRAIKKQAFSGSGLQNLTIPTTVEELGDEVFANCGSLDRVTFNGQVTSFGSNIFYNSGITTIKVSTMYETYYRNLLGDYAGFVVAF